MPFVPVYILTATIVFNRLLVTSMMVFAVVCFTARTRPSFPNFVNLGKILYSFLLRLSSRRPQALSASFVSHSAIISGCISLFISSKLVIFVLKPLMLLYSKVIVFCFFLLLLTLFTCGIFEFELILGDCRCTLHGRAEPDSGPSSSSFVVTVLGSLTGLGVKNAGVV